MSYTTRNPRRPRFASSIGAMALLLTSCADDTSPARREQAPDSSAGDEHARKDAAPPPADEQPDVAAFHAALEEQRYDDLPEIIAALDQAAAARPEDPEVVLALALANLWAVAETGRAAPDPARDGMHALAAQGQLERARELSPQDARIDGWLGSLRVRIGITVGSDDLVQTGFEEIAAGVARSPEFNLFVQAFRLAGSASAAGDPKLAQAADAFLEAAALCQLGVTRDAPELASPGRDPAPGVATACRNAPSAPHNLEGFWLYGGDILLKGGDRATALAFYDNARREGVARSWDFVAVAEQRLADAASWADDLADDDADNDPVLAWDSAEQCVLCHAR